MLLLFIQIVINILHAVYVRTYYADYTLNNNNINKDIEDIKRYINILNKDIKDINNSVESAFRHIDYLIEKDRE